jgi:hypothetical protein
LKLRIDFQTPDLILLIFIFAVAFVLAFLSYRFTLPPLKAREKVLLLVLRWLVLTSLFLALGEALVGMTKKSWEKPRIALLLDSSRSMNIKDKAVSRKEVLQNLLAEKSFKEVRSEAEIRPYLFSDSLVPYILSGKLPAFSGEATSIGNSLEKLKENLRGEELTSVILISDGTNNAGEDPIAIARNYTIPVYTVGIGEFVPFKDLSLEKVKYDEIAYSGENDTVKVTVKNQGYKGVKIPVLLQENKKVLARKELSFNISGELQETGLVFEPEEEGTHRYQVVIPKAQGESFQQNNLKSFTQKVLKKRFNLLLVSQSLNWEFSFLKRLLNLNNDIIFEALVFSKSGKPLWSGLSRGKKIEDFDLVVVLDAPQFLIQNQKEIDDLLQKKGVSLLLSAGEEFYKRKDMLSSFDFLPFEFDKNRKPLFQSFNLNLTPEGKIHPLTRLSEEPEENLFLWANLPPFEKMLPLKAKDGAKVLAQMTFGEESIPGIIIQEREKQKIEVLGFSPLWKWDFLLWGIGKDNSAYKKFWENSFRWLLSREDLERFKIYIDKAVYKKGEEIKFNSRVFDESYQKIKGAEIKIKVYPKGKEADSLLFNLMPEDGEYYYTLSFLPPGEYLFKGEARKEEIVLGSYSGKFEIEDVSLEDEDLKPDKELLKEIAQLSGGDYSEPDDFAALLKRLDLEKKPRLEIKEITLWDKPLLLFFFIFFLSFSKRFHLL